MLRQRFLERTIVRACGPLLVVLLLTTAMAACGGGGSSPTEPAPPPPAPPPGADLVVGVMGCSQTTNAWGGWIQTGDPAVWQSIASGYGGGDVADWARDIPNGDYWLRLDSNVAANDLATAIWWQICDLAANNGTIGDAEAVLAELRNRLPNVTVYVSPLAEFERPETCAKQDIAHSRVLADHLVNTGQAMRGPDLPLVLDAWIQPPQGDGGCHVGEDGKAAFGAALAAFPWDS